MLRRTALILTSLALLAGLGACKKDEDPSAASALTAPPAGVTAKRSGAATPDPAAPAPAVADAETGDVADAEADDETPIDPDAVSAELENMTPGDVLSDIRIDGDARAGNVSAKTPMGDMDISYENTEDESITAEGMGLKPPKGSTRISGTRTETDMGLPDGGMGMGMPPAAKSGDDAGKTEMKLVTETAIYNCPMAADDAIASLKKAHGDDLVDGAWMMDMAAGMMPEASAAEETVGYFVMVADDDIRQVMVLNADSEDACVLQFSQFVEAPPMFTASMKMIAGMGQPPNKPDGR